VPANGRRGRPQGKCHREQTAGPARRAARVKRRGKSPPRDRQRKRHGKPHREQDQIGVARRATGSGVSASPPGSVARGARQRASQRNGHPSLSGEDRTRLIGRLTSFLFSSDDVRRSSEVYGAVALGSGWATGFFLSPSATALRFLSITWQNQLIVDQTMIEVVDLASKSFRFLVESCSSTLLT